MAGATRAFRVGRWTADPARLVLVDDELEVHLRPKVMDLLVVFAEHPGEVLSKERLLDLVWPDVTVGDASLAVAVRELRESLDDDPEAPRFIETIRHRGYRLLAGVEPLPESATAARPAASQFWLIGDDQEFVLATGESVIGRAPDADVRLDLPNVSRHHARIVVDGDSAVVEDLGSKNGTFVNERRVDGPTRIRHGDQLRLGHVAAVLRLVRLESGSTLTDLSREPLPSRRSARSKSGG